MLPGDESLAWMTLSRTPGLDAAAVLRALAAFGHARDIVQASDAARGHAQISLPARRFLSSAQARSSRAERDWLLNPRHHVVPFNDPRFPVSLRGSRPPMLLYVAGNVDVLNDPQLAIVGSRNPTAQGLETAHEFAEQLAARGLVITSGL